MADYFHFLPPSRLGFQTCAAALGLLRCLGWFCILCGRTRCRPRRPNKTLPSLLLTTTYLLPRLHHYRCCLYQRDEVRRQLSRTSASSGWLLPHCFDRRANRAPFNSQCNSMARRCQLRLNDKYVRSKTGFRETKTGLSIRCRF